MGTIRERSVLVGAVRERSVLMGAVRERGKCVSGHNLREMEVC